MTYQAKQEPAAPSDDPSWLAQYRSLLVGGLVATAIVVGGVSCAVAYYRRKREWARVFNSDEPIDWVKNEIRKQFTLKDYIDYKAVQQAPVEDINQLLNQRYGEDLMFKIADAIGYSQSRLYIQLNQVDYDYVDWVWSKAIKRQPDEMLGPWLQRIADERQLITCRFVRDFGDQDGHVQARQARLDFKKPPRRPGISMGGYSELNIESEVYDNWFDLLQDALERQQRMILMQAEICNATGLADLARDNLLNLTELNAMDRSQPDPLALESIQASLFETQNALDIIIAQNTDYEFQTQNTLLKWHQQAFNDQRKILEGEEEVSQSGDTDSGHFFDED